MTKYPHHSEVILYLALGFIVGVGIFLWDVFPVDVTAFLVGVLGIMCLATFGVSRKGYLTILLLLGLLWGAMHTEVYFYNLADHRILVPGEKFETHITSVPRLSGRSLSAFGEIEGSEKILIRFPKYERVDLGDFIEIRCENIKKPEAFGGFDYPRYLQMKGVHQICEQPIYRKISGDETLSTASLRRLAQFRTEREAVIAKLIRAPESALANGLLFGGDDRLSEDLQDAFARTGMTHIVAVSGYNVSVIVIAVTTVGVFFGLWRRQAAVIALVLVILFVAMIGFPASGVRAGIMGSLGLLAVMYGRASNALGAVALAATLMLLWNPLQLRYDVGFQLSFVAVVGILFFAPIFVRFLARQHRAFGLTEMIILTFTAQVFVAPIIMIHFQSFATTSLLANALVLPILPLTMLLAFITVVLSMFSALLATPFAWLTQWLLTYEIFVIEFFAARSWSNIQITEVSVSLIMLYYLFLFVVCYYFMNKKYDN